MASKKKRAGVLLASSKPVVFVAVQVRPSNTEYVVLSVSVTGAVVDHNRLVSGDYGCQVPPGLVGKTMSVRVAVASLKKEKIKAFTTIWSSRGVDDPSTVVDERWKRLAKPQSGDGKLVIKGKFNAYKGKVL